MGRTSGEGFLEVGVAATRPRFPHATPCALIVPLLEWAAMSWIDGVMGLTEDQWTVVGFMGSALAWIVVLTVWYMRTRTKTK
ncbi:MAG: hypothetical protein ABIO96_10145 [Nitrospiraceae bacterium]